MTCPPPSSPTQEECLPPHKRRLRAAEEVNATRRSPAFPGKILALPVFPLGVKMMIFPSPAALKSLRYPRNSQLQTSARRRNQTNQTIPAAATKPLTPTQSACLPAKASSKKRLPLQQYFPRPSQRSVASQSSKNAYSVPSGTGFKEQESILGFRRIRSENSSGSSSFSSRSLRAKRRRKPACTASFPSYDGASVHILAISSFTETDHRLSYSCRTGRAQGSLGYVQTRRDLSRLDQGRRGFGGRAPRIACQNLTTA